MFFISGITGKVGGAAARHLLASGHTVRSLVRDPQKAEECSEKGVDIHQGDSADPIAVALALQGVEGAFLMVPPFQAPEPGYPESKAIIASLSQAVSQAPPPRLVLLSSVGSEQTSGLGLITATHLLEQAFNDLPFPTAFVRAGSFLENYIPSLKPTAATGWFDTFFTPVELEVPVIATEDIGKQIANLLSAGWSGKKIVELGSPYSSNNLASAISEALGRPVQARSIPREQWSKTFESFGIPAGRSGAFEEMEDGFNAGWIAFGVPGTEPVAATITPAQFFRAAVSS